MSSAERVTKYLSDAQALVQAKPQNPGKIKSEIAKLATWLRLDATPVQTSMPMLTGGSFCLQETPV
eukprot:1255840-Rhodomonas_salina.3